MITIIARADCRYCHGSGEVSDSVPYGMGNVSMYTACDACLEAGWPDGTDVDDEYEIVPAWEPTDDEYYRVEEMLFEARRPAPHDPYSA